LYALRDIVDPLKELGATLVAITPQIAEKSIEMIEKHKLQFDMLSDPGLAYAAELGIRFDVHPDAKELYLGFGNDLAKTNGDPSWTLPVPTRLVVDQQGIVRVADIDYDYTKRPEPQKTVDDVKAMLGK
ncbi:MAG: redoxin domain-containing protein, partial [Alphaproteobacteria bacterium]|nr:redoxin domain-containing protein [Alphaproteobacteria bacterium]